MSEQLKTFKIDLEVLTAAYANGDAVGQKFELDGAALRPKGGGIIQSMTLVDKDDDGVEVDVVLFDDDFSATTDGSSMNISDEDANKLIGTVNLATYKDQGDVKTATASNIQLGYSCKSKSIFGQLITRGTPTYADGPGSLKLIVSILLVS